MNFNTRRLWSLVDQRITMIDEIRSIVPLVDLNYRDNGYNVLWTANLRPNNFPTILYLLECGVSPIVSNRTRNNILQHILVYGIGDIDCDNMLNFVRNVVGKYIDVNHTNMDGTTVLHIACKYSYINLAVLLLNLGADPNIQDKTGSVPRAGILMGKNRKNMQEYDDAVDLIHLR